MPFTLEDTSVEFLNNLNNEELDEEIVVIFIACANAERRAAGLPDLSIGSLSRTLPFVAGRPLIRRFRTPAERESHR